jgi:hypothetical protein
MRRREIAIRVRTTVPQIVQQTWGALRALPRAYLFAPVGALLALGAPVGFGVICAGRAPTWTWIAADLARHPASYVYLTVVTGAVFGFVGYVFGRVRAMDAVARIGDHEMAVLLPTPATRSPPPTRPWRRPRPPAVARSPLQNERGRLRARRAAGATPR